MDGSFLVILATDKSSFHCCVSNQLMFCVFDILIAARFWRFPFTGCQGRRWRKAFCDVDRIRDMVSLRIQPIHLSKTTYPLKIIFKNFIGFICSFFWEDNYWYLYCKVWVLIGLSQRYQTKTVVVLLASRVIYSDNYSPALPACIQIVSYHELLKDTGGLYSGISHNAWGDAWRSGQAARGHDA